MDSKLQAETLETLINEKSTKTHELKVILHNTVYFHGKIKKIVIVEMASISVWEYSVFVSNILNQSFLEAYILLVYHPMSLHI
jgi:hypothetical protein